MPYVSKEEAQRSLAARGFGTFKKWAKENRKGASLQRSKGKKGIELLKALDDEYERLIKPWL